MELVCGEGGGTVTISFIFCLCFFFFFFFFWSGEDFSEIGILGIEGNRVIFFFGTFSVHRMNGIILMPSCHKSSYVHKAL